MLPFARSTQFSSGSPGQPPQDRGPSPPMSDHPLHPRTIVVESWQASWVASLSDLGQAPDDALVGILASARVAQGVRGRHRGNPRSRLAS